MNTGWEVRRRAGREAVLAEVAAFASGLGRVESEWKHDGSRVTAVDRAIAGRIRARLLAACPGDEVLTEEDEVTAGERTLRATYAWVLDPIDGTNNYALGLPTCSISLGLLEHGEPVWGAVWDHSRGRLITGGRDTPLLDGDRPVRVERRALHRESLVALHAPFASAEAARLLPVLREHKVRALGSSALHLAYVALGLLDGVVDFNVKVWDIAAGVALVRASGGDVHFLQGTPFPGGDVHFLQGTPFPLRTFSVQAPRLPYVAGGREACERLAALVAG